jgi:hypothetical protein
LDIRLLGAYAVTLEADALAHPVQQLGRFGHMRSVSASRLGGLILDHRVDPIDFFQEQTIIRPIRLGRLLNSWGA